LRVRDELLPVNVELLGKYRNKRKYILTGRVIFNIFYPFKNIANGILFEVELKKNIK
jgi:hypothetical protein